MDSFIIKGGTPLEGEVTLSGSKNAALPIIAATLLTTDKVVLRNVPDLADIRHLAELLESLGTRVKRDPDGSMHIQTIDESNFKAEYDYVRKMRASISVLGPLLAKRKRAIVSLPGGCNIGDRPINLHIKGIRALAASVRLSEGYIDAQSPKLIGSEIFLGGPFGSTVLGTANIMSAAALATGTTTIESAACEPEIVDLANFLNRLGAKITGHGTPRITIEGVNELHGADYTIIPDRVEAGTFMAAAAITKGQLTIKNCPSQHLVAVIDSFRKLGIHIETKNHDLHIAADSRAKPTDLTTQPYPGFPTDLQAQVMALLCLADGNSIITEKIFPDRFMHIAELNRMGANLRKEGPSVIVQGVPRLIGAHVMASDLRASAALILAGLIAEGQTTVLRVYHIDRGYERIEEKLNRLGADIQRVKEPKVDSFDPILFPPHPAQPPASTLRRKPVPHR